MCKGPKAPDNSAQIAEQKRQFDIEQQRLRDQMAREQAEAERQRQAAQAYYEEQLRIQKEQAAVEAAAREQARQLQERQAAEAQARWEAEQAAQQQQRDLEQRQYEAQVAEQTRQRQLLEEQQRQAAEEAAARQRAIDSATSGINSNFDRFNDAYFQQFQQDYLGYYTPEVDKQLSEAQKQAAFSLERRGIADSSAAADTYAKIAEADAKARADIARQAAEQSATLRNQINTQKNALLSQAVAAGGGQQYVDAAASYKAPTAEKSALGDLFAGLVAADPTAAGRAADATTLDGVADGGTDGTARVVGMQAKATKKSAAPTTAKPGASYAVPMTA